MAHPQNTNAAWRLAVAGPVTHPDTPALMLNRIDGVEAWRPVRAIKRRQGMRRRIVYRPVPVFGPYLFLRCAADRIPALSAVQCDGRTVLSRVITGGCGVSAIPEAEIAALRAGVSAGVFDTGPGTRLRPGDSARIAGGALDGFAAAIETILGDKARVTVALFGGGSKATVPLASLEAL